MGKKILIIEDCVDCPNNQTFGYCKSTDKPTTSGVIRDDCPLPDEVDCIDCKSLDTKLGHDDDIFVCGILKVELSENISGFPIKKQECINRGLAK